MFRTPRLRAPRQQKKGGSVQAALAVLAAGVAVALTAQPALARPHGYMDPAGQYVAAGGPVSLSPDDRALPRSTAAADPSHVIAGGPVSLSPDDRALPRSIVDARPTRAYDSPERFIAGRRAAAKNPSEQPPRLTASHDGFDWGAAWIGASTGAVIVAGLVLSLVIVRRVRTHSLAA